MSHNPHLPIRFPFARWQIQCSCPWQLLQLRSKSHSVALDRCLAIRFGSWGAQNWAKYDVPVLKTKWSGSYMIYPPTISNNQSIYIYTCIRILMPRNAISRGYCQHNLLVMSLYDVCFSDVTITSLKSIDWLSINQTPKGSDFNTMSWCWQVHRWWVFGLSLDLLQNGGRKVSNTSY